MCQLQDEEKASFGVPMEMMGWSKFNEGSSLGLARHRETTRSSVEVVGYKEFIGGSSGG